MSNSEMGIRRSALPGLLGLAAAALLWWFGDTWRTERATVDQQLATMQRLLRTDTANEDRSTLEQRGAALRQARLAWQERLADEADLQLVRARLFYDLRQRCYDVKLNCLIRLSDIAAADMNERKGAASGDPLLTLGVSRARATISGLLGDQELGDVLSVFSQDGRRVWRFNRIQVKGRAFEIDIERHVVSKKGDA